MTVTDLPREPATPPSGTAELKPESKFRLLKIIGPGVITGASDDDPPVSAHTVRPAHSLASRSPGRWYSPSR